MLIWYSFINTIVPASIWVTIIELFSLIWICSTIMWNFSVIILGWTITVCWWSVKNWIGGPIERIISQHIINIDRCIRSRWLRYVRNSINIVWIRVKSSHIWIIISRVAWIFACRRKGRCIWMSVIVICWEIRSWL